MGCGPGKISCALAGAFTSVTAVYPSEHMIALGRSLPVGNAGNIQWMLAAATVRSKGPTLAGKSSAKLSIHRI
ncbi:class I SAM-dependent methyltransferase, partial [Rhizobium ruizarguesonis]